MTIIEAAAMRCKTMADGSLRIECEVEPANAQAAFALFGMPGAPMALAALKVGHAAKSDEPRPPRAPAGDGGKPIARWLALRCREPEFRNWVGQQSGSIVTDEGAAEWCRRTCDVASRGDIDGDQQAEALFRKHIQGPWSLHYQATHG